MKSLVNECIRAMATTIISGIGSVIGLCVGVQLWDKKVEPWMNKKLG